MIIFNQPTIRAKHLSRLWIYGLTMGCMVYAGCTLDVDTGGGGGGGDTIVDGNLGGGVPTGSGKTSGEPNDTFNQAIESIFDVSSIARLQGTISQTGDMDVYVLGSFSPGDRVTADVFTTLSPLDASVGVFDRLGRLVFNNDDRGGTASRFLDPVIDFIARHQSDTYYLVMTHSAFADAGTFTGVYQVDVQITRGGVAPTPVAQILLLDFDGAVLDTPSLVQPLGFSRLVVDPFNADNISPVYTGQTEEMKQAIRDGFVQNFIRFNVTVLTTDDPPPPFGSNVTTIVLGGFNQDLFGIAQSVDLYNMDFCDDAIIFTESFQPVNFSLVPTAAELGIAIANVGAHEAGHLLGLNHVDDDRAIMDDRSPADVFLTDQEFRSSPLSSDIMSIGSQDAVLLLSESVGFSAIGMTAKRSTTIYRVQPSVQLGGRMWRKVQRKSH